MYLCATMSILFFILKIKNVILHPYFPITATSQQGSLSSAPKVAVVGRSSVSAIVKRGF